MKPGPSLPGQQEKTAQAGGSDSHGTYFLLLCCLAFSYAYGLMPSIPYDLLPEEGKACFPKGSAWCAGTSPFRIAPKNDEEKFSKEAEHSVVYFVGTEMARLLDPHCLVGND